MHVITRKNLVLHVNAYKWKRCLKKKCCKQCGQVKFMDTMTKWPVQKHTEVLSFYACLLLTTAGGKERVGERIRVTPNFSHTLSL